MNHLDNGTFNEFVAEGLTCIDFYAAWCGPCRALSPIIEKMASERKDIKFAKVDIDDMSEIANSLNVRSIPTLIFFKDGSEIDRVVGLMPESKIASKIDGLKK